MDRTSMQLSVPGYTETTPTYFSIQVCYEQETYAIKKRYSDFVELAAQLEEEMGEPAPTDLPAKKWIGNGNREFLDGRRKGLEAFLRSIVKRDEWRESLAFVRFIELSKHVKSQSSKATKARGEWVKGVAEARELMANVSKQGGDSAEERRLCILATNKLKDLESSLVEDSSLGDGEYRRRRDILNELGRILEKTKLRATTISTTGVPRSNGSTDISADLNHTKLFGNRSERSASPRVLGGGSETDRTRDLNNSQLLVQQQTDMGDQDQIIENLRKNIARQKQLGLDINEELVFQNRLLDDLDDQTHATNGRLNQARRRAGKLG